MPKILLVKTSSMGDVIHNLPVATDIQRNFPGAVLDWVVEEAFADIPKLHPAVRRVIPVAVRRWRRNAVGRATLRELKALRDDLRRETYDLVLDTQGLLKSALISRIARGHRVGLSRDSAREPVAARLYQQSFPIAKGEHAVKRNRELAARALGYTSTDEIDYGIHAPFEPGLLEVPYAALLHATSRAPKLWPESNWAQLGEYLKSLGMASVLPWGSAEERERSHRLAAQIAGAVVPPALSLSQAAALLARARIVIGVDTGLAHLAAALKRPVVGIYCATDPGLTGIYAPGLNVNLGGAGRSPTPAEAIAAVDRLQRDA